MDAARTATAFLRQIGHQSDGAIDLAEAALAFATVDRPDIDPSSYRAHLAALAREVGVAAQADAIDRANALRAVLVGQHGYTGDRESYDDLDNANLMRVIDRRRGLPIALSILWLHAARAQGWTAEGLNFPNHFLIRIETGQGRIVLDPFNDGKVLSQAELRRLRRRIGGGESDLRPEDCEPVSNRAILLRLQNNIKLRLLQASRIEDALVVAERMVLVAPRQPALWHECAALHNRLGSLKAATACLEQVIALAEPGASRQGVIAELQALQRKLN